MGQIIGKDDLILDTKRADPEPEAPSFRTSVILCTNAVLMLALLFSIFVIAIDGFYT